MPEVKKEIGIRAKKKNTLSSRLIISYSLYYKQTLIKLIFGTMSGEELPEALSFKRRNRQGTSHMFPGFRGCLLAWQRQKSLFPKH